MPQLVLIHRDDAKIPALKLYAFFRNRLPHFTIKPNTQAILNEGLSIGQSIFNTNFVIFVLGSSSNNAWLGDEKDNDSIALKAALTTNKMVFVLRYDGAQIPTNLPEKLTGLKNMMSFDVDDENLYQISEILMSFIAQASPASAEPAILDKTYPSNPKYPDSGRTIHLDLSPAAFQHPLDRLATENLDKINGFNTLVKKFLEFGFERVDQVLYAANSIKVGPNQYTKLYKMLAEAAAILDMPMPDMYVILRDSVNAFTFGHTRPYIVVYSPLLDMMSDDEIMAVIAHELGHIKCSHVLYTQVARYAAPLISGIVGNIPIIGELGKLAFDVTIQIALLTWSRRSELSADRASLLVMQDPAPCVGMLAKLAGGSLHMQDELSLQGFIEQAEEYNPNEDSSNLDKFYRFWAFMSQTTHPFPVERARFLNDYIDGVEYQQILDGIYLRVDSKTE